MNTIPKRVRVSLPEKLVEVYDYCVAEQQILGNMIIEYLDLKYSYKSLISQSGNRENLAKLSQKKLLLNEQYLHFDYEKKQRLLEGLAKELKHEYSFLLAIVREEENPTECLSEHNRKRKQINNSTPEIEQQKQQNDYEYKETQNEFDEDYDEEEEDEEE